MAFGLENLGMIHEEINKIVDKSLEIVNLSEYKTHLTNKLSGGQKQRLAIAGILAMNPKYIIFDEATSMIDKTGRTEILNTIKELNKNNITIILITHNMEEVAFADRVIAMNNGKIVLQGNASEIFENISLLKELELDIPLCTELIHELKEAGIDLPVDNVLTCDECVDILFNLMYIEH